ncbi:MAG: M3 family metallopeptidase [Acidobacteria bacterium]|nr:M3 family metallopeptidase [Acidobacteriota bacterium]
MTTPSTCPALLRPVIALCLGLCLAPAPWADPPARPPSTPGAGQAAAPGAQGKTAVTANPLLEDWKTPFGVPPFDRIRPEHYRPAFETAIALNRREVDAIVKSEDTPSFANTVEALEASGQLLDKVGAVFFALSSADTNAEIQAIAKEIAPQLAALHDDVLLDETLYRRVRGLWERRAELGLASEQAKLLQETYEDFVRAGANLPPEKKKRLREVNQELSVLGPRFGDNLLKETNAYRLVIDNEQDLAGLPPSVVAAAAGAAKAAGLEQKWVFTLHAPSIWPFLTFADNRELRRQILEAYTSRGNRGNDADNNATLARTAVLRAERAALLGYKTHADYVLEDNMAGTPARVYELLNRVWPPALALARKELAELQATAKAAGTEFKIEPWDWRYYAEKVRKARYDLDDEELRPYFQLDRVREGAFYVANKLYGITFTERSDIPKYHPEVRTFEVKDADGSHLAVYMVDYHPRASKRGGAWAGGFRGQWVQDGKDIRPIVTNVLNVTPGTKDTPALLSLEETETLFHEFGHALHSILSRVTYRSLRSVPRDFVELPSQVMEHWVTEPEVLKVYARHYKTGAPMPEELIKKIKASALFNQGFATVEYVAASFLDMDWHTLEVGKTPEVGPFESASLKRIGLLPEIVVRYRSPYFNHIFGPGGGYAAGYYSYIWSEVLDADAFEAFKEKGIFDKATATSFRKNVLERGGTEEPMVLYKRFRGREPSVEPLLKGRGLL